MPKARSWLTILLITRDRLVRADFGPGRAPALAALDEDRRPAVDDLPSLVEAALRLAARPPGRVWVMSSDLWTQTLPLAPEAIAGLRQEEIGRALGFEAEPFSGISALEAAAASVALPDRDRQRWFWLTEIAASQLEQVEYAVTQAGGRLMGISHPGGLSRPLSQVSEQAAWQRVELWPGAIVAVQGGQGVRPSVFVRNIDPKPDRWEADVEHWRAQQPPATVCESLHATSSVAVEELPSECRFSLEEPADVRRFLEAWARQLADHEPALPLVRVPKRPMSAAARRGWAAALGLISLLLCVAVHLLIENRRAYLVAETERLQGPAQQLAGLKKDCDALQAQQAERTKDCRKRTDDLEHYQQVMRAQRQRLATMLTVLAQHSTDETLIRKIEGGEDEIVLHGLTLRPESASALAEALADALGPQGWHVQPPSRHARKVLAGGGPWEFELRIQEPAPDPAAPAAAAVPAKHGKLP